MPDTAMQHSLSSEQTLLTAWTFGSYEQLRTRASPFHLNLCRLERGDHSPQHFLRLPLCPAPCCVSHGDLASLVPPWAEPGLTRAPQHPAGLTELSTRSDCPSSCQTQTPALLHRPIRGGFATHTEPGLGYKCWLLHDMGYNWNIRQLLETALLLHANECFCCHIFCKSPAHPCLAAGSGALRDDVGVAV